MRKERTGRLSVTAIVGTAMLMLGSSMLVAGPAMAAPGEGGNGTLTVHKLEQPDGDLGPNDGSELELAEVKPLEAGFTVCTIDDIDLTVSAHWERLKDIEVTLDTEGKPVATEDGSTLSLTCGTEQSTAPEDGKTKFDLPADKAYVVYESTAPANALPGSAPTVITIPYPGNGAAGQPDWNYNPHIYPKNSLAGSGATKDGKIVGGDILWDVTVPIAPLPEGKTYSEVRINDQLADFVEYVEGTVVLTDASGTEVPLQDGTDYTLTSPSGNGGDEVVLTLLEPGLTKFEANIGGKLVLSIAAKAIGTGSTANEAQITINGTSTDPGTGPEVTDPEDFFAGAHIMKEAKKKGASENVPLAGAKFDVYAAKSGTTKCPAEPAGDAEKVVADAESGADGKTPTEVLAEGSYCVYETFVPQGYKGLKTGMLMTVDGEDSSVTVLNTQIGADEGDLPSLPITGAMGSVLLIAGGAALLLIAGLLIAARRKRQRQ